MTRESILVAAAAMVAVAACQLERPRAREAAAHSSGSPVHTSAVVPVAVAPAAALAEPSPRAPAKPPAVERLLHVPRAPYAIVPSTHFDVKTWGSSVSTHTLTDEHGNGAVPVSEGRFLWRDGYLYVLFYAGDLDLQIRTTRRDGPVWKDDSFTLSFFEPGEKKRMISISATGVVADGVCPLEAETLGDAGCDLAWTSGVRAAADWDGTINKLGDFDEEWNVQAAIPLRAIAPTSLAAGARIPVALTRCEIAYDGRRACGAWGSTAKPAELVLD